MAHLALPAIAGITGAAYLDAKHNVLSDLFMGYCLVKSQASVNKAVKSDNASVFHWFEQTAKAQPNDPCYVCENTTYTWKECAVKVNQISHWLLSQGFQKKDVLALVMTNKPAYPLIWLGCLAIDVIPAFINYNLRGKGLAHCINVSKARLVVYDADLESFIDEISSQLTASNYASWTDEFVEPTPPTSLQNVQKLSWASLENQSTKPVGHSYRKGIATTSAAVYVYTSGTTGLPKAATCAHGRVSAAANMWTNVNSFSKKDRIYTPMPLYHSTASFLAIAASWVSGATVIIGRKFSATKYWQEVNQHDATVIQYVGEVCRYLLAAPPSPLDRKHRVRMAYGNGMRPDVWQKFRERFNVPEVSEFFASTEGIGSTFNRNSGPNGAGAVGKEGFLATLKRSKDQAIIEIDPDTEEIARDKKGFCVRVQPNQPGEMIARIDPSSVYANFTGYANNAEATKKKILTDVFVKGDAWFRTGDLLRKDTDGHIYFGDRLGDTFRWKSENVSTAEVAAVLGEAVSEANVYGVIVPTYEGRAGCAAIPADSKLDFAKLGQHVSKHLPKYAQPVFVRLVPQMEATGTVKHVKVQLRNEGVDPNKVKDPVYWLQHGAYVPFGLDDWNQLLAGKVKL